MARIRRVEIKNFRGIASLDWTPSPGLNCLVGPGDSGKSTVLDAIDACLGARRQLQFCDSDFHRMRTAEPLEITITLGDLDAELRSFDAYGVYLRGYDASTGLIEDEPDADLEDALVLRLTVGNDLEPAWSLVSDRAPDGAGRFLTWAHRNRIAPTRLGAFAEHHTSWRRGSVLNRLQPDRADTSGALVEAARQARANFGDEAAAQLEPTIAAARAVADELGIDYGDRLRAMLDAHSISLTSGTVSLHDADGVPLRALGVGSTRLLIAGLQRRASEACPIALVDEIEHGLEPHRIIRLLTSLGAKERDPPLQVFVTSHSPTVVRELSLEQLYVTRNAGGACILKRADMAGNVQGTVRAYPEALLASRVLVCEGATEVGLVRGLDQAGWGWCPSLAALGVALVDGNGISNVFGRALALARLGYQTAVLCDDDAGPDPAAASEFGDLGGVVVRWRAGRATEDELFLSLSDGAVQALIAMVEETLGADLLDQQIRSASGGASHLSACKQELGADNRALLARIAKMKKHSWFKNITTMEKGGREIVSPDEELMDVGFKCTLDSLFCWMSGKS